MTVVKMRHEDMPAYLTADQTGRTAACSEGKEDMETILAVEDDDSIRNLVKMTLEMDGKTVLTADNQTKT